MSAPTILLGLDGASWELIDRLDISLPTIDTIRAEHVSAVSESNLPPVTCPSWRCLSSGKTPGQLGVYWWERIDIKQGEIHLSEASDFQTADIWDYLAESDSEVGIVNMPLTYPPKTNEIPFVAGGPACGSENYASPDGLAKELETEIGYRVHSKTTVSDQKEEITEDVLELIDLRFEASKYLYRKYDLEFLFTVIYYLVRLEHYYWDDEPVKRAWKRIDEHLEWFVDEGFNIIITSDHGCAEIDTVFNINEWLSEQGYIELVGSDSSLKQTFATRGINTEDIAALLNQFGVQRVVSHLVPDIIKNRIPDSAAGYSGQKKGKIIDWNRSTAVASGQGPVYLTRDADTESIVDGLRAVTGPSGRPLFEAVHRTAGLYSESKTDPDAPELIVEARKGVHVTDAIGSGTVAQTASSRDKWRAENYKDGLFAARGPNINSEWNREQIALCDVAPTVLHLLDRSVPADMAGQVHPIGTEKREIQTSEPIDPQTESGGDQDTSVENRLEDLGYL